MNIEEIRLAVQNYDAWDECNGECDPNPSDAFEQASRYVKDFVLKLLSADEPI